MYASSVFIALVAAVSAAPQRPNVEPNVKTNGTTNGQSDVGTSPNTGVATSPETDVATNIRSVSVDQISEVCGTNNSVHCCNDEDDDGPLASLLDLDLSGILGGCTDITVQIISLLLPSRDHCSQQTVCCDQSVVSYFSPIFLPEATCKLTRPPGHRQRRLHSHQHPLSVFVGR